MGEAQREFWSAVAAKYDDVVDAQIGEGSRAMVRDRLATEGGLGDVAELGCGTGFYTGALAERANHVAATDFSFAMVALARRRVPGSNVTFTVQDCQRSSFATGAFDTAFMSLVIHFTEAEKTLGEMRRILKPGGTLIIVNLDPGALHGLARVRGMVRVAYRGLTGYRSKPPRRFGRNLLGLEELRRLLGNSGFRVLDAETVTDAARSSNIPLDYVRAVKA